MRRLVIILMVLVQLSILIASISGAGTDNPQPTQTGVRALQSEGENLIIEGIVEKIGDAQGVGSGDHAVYQFAKYRLASVCKGDYGQREIVIDHLILQGSELEGLHEGDRVRLIIKKSKTIFSRRNEEGFRNPDDKIDIFYTAGKPKPVPPNCATCEPCG